MNKVIFICLFICLLFSCKLGEGFKNNKDQFQLDSSRLSDNSNLVEKKEEIRPYNFTISALEERDISNAIQLGDKKFGGSEYKKR